MKLSLEQWEVFERKLNTYNSERERRANTFLTKCDEIVKVHQTANGYEINIPWLDDENLTF